MCDNSQTLDDTLKNGSETYFPRWWKLTPIIRGYRWIYDCLFLFKKHYKKLQQTSQLLTKWQEHRTKAYI